MDESKIGTCEECGGPACADRRKNYLEAREIGVEKTLSGQAVSATIDVPRDIVGSVDKTRFTGFRIEIDRFGCVRLFHDPSYLLCGGCIHEAHRLAWAIQEDLRDASDARGQQ